MPPSLSNALVAPSELRVAVLQSNYLPWKGYFDIIRRSDLFVFYDDVQFTKNDWRNRNQIKTPKGTQWISVPVGGRIHRLIHEVEIESSDWQKSHWGKIQANYRQAPHFKTYGPFIQDLILGKTWTNLSELNQSTIQRISKEILGITNTKFIDSREFSLSGSSQDRLLMLLKKVGTTCYISGPAAKSYIEPKVFQENRVELEYMDYSKYPQYPQLYPPFVHAVSIIDLILNCGAEASKYF